MKRFQDSSKLVQIWRYRWYLLIPFKYFWYNYIVNFKVYNFDGEGKEVKYGKDGKSQAYYEMIKGKNLWGILKGDAQVSMNWMYDHEDIMAEIREKHPSISNSSGCDIGLIDHGDVDEY